MITVICLSAKNDLEVIVASRLGYERENKRFYFEMMGSPVVYYYENVDSELAGSAIKTALKQGGTNLKDFGPYKVKKPERPAPPHPVAPPKAERADKDEAPRIERACPRVAGEGKVGPAARKPREMLNKEEAAANKPSFMEKMGKVVDDGVKKLKTTMQEVAVVAEEEDKKDKEKAAARKAEWNAKKAALEEKVEERRARRAAEKAARAEYDDEDDDDEIGSDFDEIAQSVAAAAEIAVDDSLNMGGESGAEDAIVTDTVANVMANKQVSNPDNDLREITQLNLDFGDIDDMMDDIMG